MMTCVVLGRNRGFHDLVLVGDRFVRDVQGGGWYVKGTVVDRAALVMMMIG